jgi:hypothetical protein
MFEAFHRMGHKGGQNTILAGQTKQTLTIYN